VAEIALLPARQVFIFGHARSGTTLLTRLVRLHAEVHCNYQAHFFTRRLLPRRTGRPPEVEEWLSRKSNRGITVRTYRVMLRAAAEYGWSAGGGR
jgi:hypothetical protein